MLIYQYSALVSRVTATRLLKVGDEAVENGAKDAVDISAIERYNKVEGRSCK